RDMATYGGDEVAEIDYVNPETGQDVLPTLGFTAIMLTSGQSFKPPLKSSSAAFHIVSGSGAVTINGHRFAYSAKDALSVPVFAEISVTADAETFVIIVHDRPLQEKLAYYEERAR
ncbi:MAG: cupin, partial [Pseudomonadota bacterium]